MKTTKDDARKIGRLLKRADFLRVQSGGKKWVTPHVIIQMAPMPSQSPEDPAPSEHVCMPKVLCRLGLTVPKKIFKSAVDRNRVRRRLRALMIDALCEKPPPAPVDIVILPRTPALNAPSDVLQKDIKWALKRLTQ